MAGTFSKKELEKKKLKARQDKAEKMQQRKLHNNKGKGIEDMMAYIDENGNLTSRPPDLHNRKEIDPADIVLGAAPQGREHDTQRTGFVLSFDETKGYGFISDSQSKENVFVHINNTSQVLKKGNKVSYERQKGPKGFIAVNVQVLRQ
jgi:cold shock protein